MLPLLYISARFALLTLAFALSTWVYLKLMRGVDRHSLRRPTGLLGAAAGCLVLFAVECGFVWSAQPARWQWLVGFPTGNIFALLCALAPAGWAWRSFRTKVAREFRVLEISVLAFRPGIDARADYEWVTAQQTALETFSGFGPFLAARRCRRVHEILNEHARRLAPSYNLAQARWELAQGHPADALERLTRVCPKSLETVLVGLEIRAAYPSVLQLLRSEPDATPEIGSEQKRLLLLEAAQLLAEQHWDDAALRAQALDVLTDQASDRRRAFLHYRHGDTPQARAIVRHDPSADLLFND